MEKQHEKTAVRIGAYTTLIGSLCMLGGAAIWSYIALLTGFLNVLAQFAGGLATYGFLIIPVGMGWMPGASVVLYRRLGKLAQ